MQKGIAVLKFVPPQATFNWTEYYDPAQPLFTKQSSLSSSSHCEYGWFQGLFIAGDALTTRKQYGLLGTRTRIFVYNW
jgi:hypothetical protein